MPLHVVAMQTPAAHMLIFGCQLRAQKRHLCTIITSVIFFPYSDRTLHSQRQSQSALPKGGCVTAVHEQWGWLGWERTTEPCLLVRSVPFGAGVR